MQPEVFEDCAVIRDRTWAYLQVRLEPPSWPLTTLMVTTVSLAMSHNTGDVVNPTYKQSLSHSPKETTLGKKASRT